MAGALARDAGLVIFPPAEVSTQVEALRRAYAPHALIDPHITLAYPPFAPEDEWLLVRPAFEEALRAFASFDIFLRGLGVFVTDEALVLWLRPDDDGTLARLHRRLNARFPDYVPAGRFAYVPHMTLALFETEAALRAVEAALAEQVTPLRFRAETVSYVVLGEDGRWHERDRLPLG